MSLSKPDIIAYAGLSAFLGLAMALIIQNRVQNSALEDKKKIRDIGESKQVGKQMTLLRKRTSTGNLGNLGGQESPSKLQDSIKSGTSSVTGVDDFFNESDAVELKKQIRRQQS